MFTPRKSNPKRFEATAKHALKHGEDGAQITRRYGVKNVIEGQGFEKLAITSKISRISTEHIEPKDRPDSKL